jgi:hypothetical protein
LEGTAWYWEGHGVWVTCAHLFPQDSPKNLEIELWDVEGRCRVLSPPWREDSLDVAFFAGYAAGRLGTGESPSRRGGLVLYGWSAFRIEFFLSGGICSSGAPNREPNLLSAILVGGAGQFGQSGP